MIDYKTEAMKLVGRDENEDILAMGFANSNAGRTDGVMDIYVFLKKDHSDKIPAAIFEYNEKYSNKNEDKVVFFDEEDEDAYNSPNFTLFWTRREG